MNFRKLVVLVSLLALSAAPGFCLQSFSESVNKSSFTLTADQYVSISSFPGTELQGVIVASATIGSILTIFDGQGNKGNLTVSTIAVINLTQVQNPQFYVSVSSGLMYNINPAPTNGVTIIWRPTKLP